MFHTLCLEKALLMVIGKHPPCSPGGASHQVHLSAPSFPQCFLLWGLPSFQSFTSKPNPNPSPVPAISPSPILKPERGLTATLYKQAFRGENVPIYLLIQCLKKKSLSLIAFGIYSNDLPRRVLRCQGFFISNISPNRIFVRIG